MTLMRMIVACILAGQAALLDAKQMHCSLYNDIGDDKRESFSYSPESNLLLYSGRPHLIPKDTKLQIMWHSNDHLNVTAY